MAGFVFLHAVNARGGDRELRIVSEADGVVRYRIRDRDHDASGALSAADVRALVADLDAMDVWTLPAIGQTHDQPTCQPWHALDIRAASRALSVRYYGSPSPRHARFHEWLYDGVLGPIHEHLRPAGETPYLMCPACSGRIAAPSGEALCPHHGTVLVRVDPWRGGHACTGCGSSVLISDAERDAKMRAMLRGEIKGFSPILAACPGCGRAIAHR